MAGLYRPVTPSAFGATDTSSSVVVMVSFVDPRGVPADAVLPYRLNHPLDDGAVIGLMANGFPDSDTFLDHVANAVSARLPAVRFERYNKGNASTPASDEMLTAVEAECDAVIAAYGH